MRSKDLEISAYAPTRRQADAAGLDPPCSARPFEMSQMSLARIEIEAVTRYWNKEIEFLLTYRARVTNGTSRGLNLRGIKIGRAVRRRADFTSARLVLRRTNEAAVCVT